MRIAPLFRRSVAVAATTALLSGGLSGLLATPAHAAVTDPTITQGGVTPSATDNGSIPTLRIQGTNFLPNATVNFIPAFSGSEVAPVSKAVETSTTPSTTVLTVKPPLVMHAPGLYDVTVSQPSATNPSQTVTSNVCSGCFSLTATGAANVATTAVGASTGSTGRGPGALDINGSNFAIGATVGFYLPDGVTLDPKMSFNVNDPNSGTSGPSGVSKSGYISSSLIRGNYTAAAGVTPGRHVVRVMNTDGRLGATADFYQPVFAASGVTPRTFGAGAQKVLLTVTGQGFKAGSVLSISKLTASNSSCYPVENTVSNPTVNADGTVLTATVSFDGCAPIGPRAVTITGTDDGGTMTVANALTVTASPVVTNLDNSVPRTLGQGASVPVTINGSGFAVGSLSGGQTAADLPVFTFGGSDVTAVTQSSTSSSPTSSTATVQLTIAQDAVTGNRSVTATNPDHGTSTTAADTFGNYPLVITPAPAPTDVSPASSAPGSTITMTVQGTNFDSAGMQFTFLTKDGSGKSVPDGSITVKNNAVTVNKGSLGAPDTATFTLLIGASTPGLRDIKIVNQSDFGTYICKGCFGIDSLSVKDKYSSAPSDNNTGPFVLTLSGAGITGTSKAELIKVGDPAYQPHLVGTLDQSSITSSKADASFDLTDAAPGTYDALVTIDSSHSLSCSACFTIVGQTPTITSITPNQGGLGAKNRTVVVKGTNFSNGMVLTIGNLQLHDLVTDTAANTVTGQVDIPLNASTGQLDVVLSNADGYKTATLTKGFTVNAGPVPSDAKNGTAAATWGQGAGTDGSTQTITVTGTCFVAGTSPATTSALDLGPGITVGTVTVTKGSAPVTGGCSTDTLTAPITVDPSAPTGAHNLTVSNPDGGTGSVPQKVVINAGPTVTSVSPSSLAPGASGQSVTLTGTGFASSPTVKVLLGNGTEDTKVHLANVTVVNATTITATVAVDADAIKGTRTIAVLNADKGYGTCAQCFAIATAPSAPQGLNVVSGSGSLNVSWTAPADNGGAPIGYYVVTVTQGSTLIGTYSPTGLSQLVTSLTNGATYTVSVRAHNVAGDSAPTTGNGVAGIPSSLTSVASVRTLTYTGKVTLSGRLMSGSTPLANRTVWLRFSPAVGAAFAKPVTTSSTGTWSYVYPPTYTFSVVASYLGDSDFRPVTAARTGATVAARVLRTAPANGATSSHTTVLRITGNVSPNKRGQYVYLFRYVGSRRTLLQRVALSSTSTYVFSLKPGAGSYTLRVYIGNTSGNVAGYSAAFLIRRS